MSARLKIVTIDSDAADGAHTLCFYYAFACRGNRKRLFFRFGRLWLSLKGTGFDPHDRCLLDTGLLHS
ncbi:MAG: hypothetical protein ABFD04_13925 [Syntrophomonas sp.]